MQLLNNSEKYVSITLALAGVFQIGQLVEELATSGRCDEQAYLTNIKSVFVLDAKDVPSVYGGPENLRIGLQEIVKVFAGNKTQKPNPNVSRYALSLILLQHKLARQKNMIGEIRKRLEFATSQVRYFSETHDTVIANLADIYMNTISTFRFRIQIVGKPQFLHNQHFIDKIRALFLAGIRSAVLWRQMGGRRWQLFLARRKIANTAKDLLDRMKPL